MNLLVVMLLFWAGVAVVSVAAAVLIIWAEAHDKPAAPFEEIEGVHPGAPNP